MNQAKEHIIHNNSNHLESIQIDHADVMLKKLIWVYFFLLVLEGGIRKWFLPGLSTPMLIIRDPVALWAMWIAYKYNRFPKNIYLSLLSFLSLFGMLTAMAFGHGNFWVALYGARIIFFHLPFMFIIGQAFSRADVIKLGKVLLIIAIPMVLLIGMQFYSPQSSFVNRGIGGNEEGGGFAGGAQGYFRPSGTFSFTLGNVLFFGFVSLFLFYFWFNSKRINKLLLFASTVALIAAIPLSISRSLLFQVLIGLAFIIATVSSKPKYIISLLVILLVSFFIVFILKDTSFFSTSTGAFTERFENANQAEGGLEGVFLDRFLGGMVSAFTTADQQPFFGYGIGMGTNVGSQLLYGESLYLIAEGEWGRIIGEMGALVGLIFIFIRSHFTFKLLIDSFNKARKGDILAWLLMSFGFLMILQGQWAQPTGLGFSVVTGGLVMACLRTDDIE